MGLVRPLVLASASPRRRQLLGCLGLPFEILAADVDETVPPGIAPGPAAEAIALRKARAVAARKRDVLVLGADTIVVAGDRILGKAADREEARAFLSLLSGTVHRVITGIALVEAPDGPGETARDETAVTLRPLGEEEILAYLDSGEWMGKAGAYAIQETADRFVVRIEGSKSNVVGLPLELLARLLRLRGLPAGPVAGRPERR